MELRKNTPSHTSIWENSFLSRQSTAFPLHQLNNPHSSTNELVSHQPYPGWASNLAFETENGTLHPTCNTTPWQTSQNQCILTTSRLCGIAEATQALGILVNTCNFTNADHTMDLIHATPSELGCRRLPSVIVWAFCDNKHLPSHHGWQGIRARELAGWLFTCLQAIAFFHLMGWWAKQYASENPNLWICRL